MARNIRRSANSRIIYRGLVCVSLVGSAGLVFADPGPQMQTGLPVQVQPTAPEPGLAQFTYPSGNPDSAGGSGGPGMTAGGSGSSGGGTLPPNQTLEQVAAQSYIQAAAEAAGISADALAATCLAESNCQNVGASSGSSASGEFQMIDSTYLAMIKQFAQDNPGIAVDTSLAGKMDPANEAYAAAQYLADGMQSLQTAGIADPTNVDMRGYYQFGAGLGAQIALAPTSQNLESIVNLTPAQMAANGITSTTTVGQWRQTYANQIGSTAYQAAI